MSLKTKLTSLIISFVLLASLLVVGVFAVKQTNFGLGGSIVFNAKGVEAQIELLSLSEDALLQGTAGTDVMKTVTIDSSLSDASDAKDASTWENVKLGFNEAGDDVTLQIKITNKYEATGNVEENNYLDISASTKNNTSKNATATVVNGTTNSVFGLLAPGDSATFTITFSVKDKGTDASIEGQLVDFDLVNLPYAEIPSTADTTEEMDFGNIYELSNKSVSEPYTASIGAKGCSTVIDGGSYPAVLSGKSIDIPAYVNDGGKIYAITGLSGAAFGFPEMSKTSGITGITLPKTLQSLGERALSYVNIESIVIPEGVTTITTHAFISNTVLKNIQLPSTLISVEGNAFQNCTNIESIVIPNGVTTIGDYAFHSCTKLSSLELPDSIISLGDGAFIDTALTSINIPKYLTSIERLHFAGISFVDLVIHEGVTNIGEGAFEDCSTLESVSLPSTLTTIGASAFKGTSIEFIRIPASVTNAGTATTYPTTLKTAVIDSPTIAGMSLMDPYGGLPGLLTTFYVKAGTTMDASLSDYYKFAKVTSDMSGYDKYVKSES